MKTKYFLIFFLFTLLIIKIGCLNKNHSHVYRTNTTGTDITGTNYSEPFYDKYSFINNTTNNLILSYIDIADHKRLFFLYSIDLQKDNAVSIWSGLRYSYFNANITNAYFYDEKTNFIFRITNYLTNIATVVTNETHSNITALIEINDNSFTNANWGTTNE